MTTTKHSDTSLNYSVIIRKKKPDGSFQNHQAGKLLGLTQYDPNYHKLRS